MVFYLRRQREGHWNRDSQILGCQFLHRMKLLLHKQALAIKLVGLALGRDPSLETDEP